MFKKSIQIVALCFLFIGQNLAKDYDIKNFGAQKGMLSTQAIQKAIDRCHQDGGGRVVVLPGQFITVQFFFCSHVKILDLVIKDTPSWAIRPGNCEDAEVRGVSILNDLLIPNSDGIHTTICRNVAKIYM